MIHKVYSDLPTFKSLEFSPGLNILLSDKTATSTRLQTRNRAGKSSLVELVHFVLGGNADRESIFRCDALRQYAFGLDVDLAGTRVDADRSGTKPSEVRVTCQDVSRWPHQPNSKGLLTNERWRTVLGALAFGLEPGGTEASAWAPKFRQLYAYFARRQASGAFVSPFRQAAQQAEGDSQVALSYILGLDWTIAQQWQIVRDRERMLREVRRAASSEALGDVLGDPAELRTRLLVAQERAGRMRANVSYFRVVPEYEALEREASEITRALGVLADDNTTDRALAEDLRSALASEHEPSLADLATLYREAGVALPDVALRSFDDAAAFHHSVIANRRMYLGGELDAAERRIAARETEMQGRDQRRHQIMGIISAGGALEQYVALQSELTRMEHDTEATRKQLETAEYMQGQRAELSIERQRLLLRLTQDMREQASRVREAIVTFEDVSSRLYEKAGSLIIQESDDGPKFDVRIQGQKSKGVSAMQIFCFDVTLMRLASERGAGPGFLIHDSHLFDGVDPRQVATALQVGAAMADEHGYQYIVTMNSDTLSAEEAPPGFNPYDHVNSVRLTDATDDGGLFGIRFG
jgi:uncharacterized protein YydD (DUF2326 family)